MHTLFAPGKANTTYAHTHMHMDRDADTEPKTDQNKTISTMYAYMYMYITSCMYSVHIGKKEEREREMRLTPMTAPFLKINKSTPTKISEGMVCMHVLLNIFINIYLLLSL